MSEQQQQYEKGKLYQYNGSEFVELEPSDQVKVPVTDDAMESIKRVRKTAQAVIGMRPELSLVASAMILEAEKLPDIAQSVKAFGQRVYNSVVAEKTEGDTQQQQETPATAEAVPEVTPPAEAQPKPEQQSASSYL